jgi:hypothetical protein
VLLKDNLITVYSIDEYMWHNIIVLLIYPFSGNKKINVDSLQDEYQNFLQNNNELDVVKSLKNNLLRKTFASKLLQRNHNEKDSFLISVIESIFLGVSDTPLLFQWLSHMILLKCIIFNNSLIILCEQNIIIPFISKILIFLTTELVRKI